MKLYLHWLSLHLKAQLQYRVSFFMAALGQFLVSFTTFLGVYFMFSRFQTVEGFTLPEVMLSFSVVLMAFSLTECFARGFDTFPQLIRTGQLDRILVRPRGVIFQVLTANMVFSRVGRLLQAALMLAVAMPGSGVQWTWDKVATLVLMLIGGIGVYTALFILYAGISFFTVEGLEFMNIFTDGTREFGKYPIAIYGEGVLKLFTYVVPIALFQYYPFLYLIGRTENRGMMLLPLVGLLFIAPCLAFFRFGLRKYRSTGS